MTTDIYYRRAAARMCEQDLFNAIRTAIAEGISVQEFRQMSAEMWDAENGDKRQADRRAWEKP